MREKIRILEYEPDAAAMHRNENTALHIDKSLASKTTRPRFGRINPAMRLSVSDLPEPDLAK